MRSCKGREHKRSVKENWRFPIRVLWVKREVSLDDGWAAGEPLNNFQVGPHAPGNLRRTFTDAECLSTCGHVITVSGRTAEAFPDARGESPFRIRKTARGGAGDLPDRRISS